MKYAIFVYFFVRENMNLSVHFLCRLSMVCFLDSVCRFFGDRSEVVDGKAPEGFLQLCSLG